MQQPERTKLAAHSVALVAVGTEVCFYRYRFAIGAVDTKDAVIPPAFQLLKNLRLFLQIAAQDEADFFFQLLVTRHEKTIGRSRASLRRLRCRGESRSPHAARRATS